MQTTHAITMYHVSKLQLEVNYVNICLPSNISGFGLAKFSISLPIPLFFHPTFMLEINVAEKLSFLLFLLQSSRL